jgi:hypothetical protein
VVPPSGALPGLFFSDQRLLSTAPASGNVCMIITSIPHLHDFARHNTVKIGHLREKAENSLYKKGKRLLYLYVIFGSLCRRKAIRATGSDTVPD